MLAILKKEINGFFSSPIAYLVIGIFLILNSLFLWVFKGQFNILDSGFADLTPFFQLSPWILIFLIPAVTMKSFAEEKRLGTLEILQTMPMKRSGLILGKFLGSFLLVLIALIPSLIYVYTVYQLGNPVGNLDMGSTIGSYLGLAFLIMAYTAIGVFASSLTENQVIAFILAVLICFVLYFGFNAFASLNVAPVFLESLGMQYHFESISRGVIDLRDLLYFVSVTIIFLILTSRTLK
ncbi:gliding motility-associated ABC transporter permease subunit GldF [Robertkochia solimangrovi]|uniref:gliding motility-associated ABC transporter permease subunit GldF n=1 Tax=Robertkochia solimangrovi TaxID=2213046 RepID=UPI00117CE68C|nr:gliding motility-associated ABC transporter permease subunit GldF [Robertkochia solimangrovi]TRZ45145.1 gliding motility-associated ABC transporter permease subunit GldF [Robertkochia solimangrovi]